MTAQILNDISWYTDHNAIDNGEPGICHSFMASLATAINYMNKDLDPAQLMGTSGFAFRIFANKVMCPSAMSMFSFSDILPEAVEQSGYNCIYISRMWDEVDIEEERREQARAAIIEGIDRGAPAIVWDISDTEWGLITGYDQDMQIYHTLTYQGNQLTLPFERLGRNGIDILSVAIPSQPNKRSQQERIYNSLKAAIAHAEQKEFIDRPDYQNGPAAYDMWAEIFEKWAIIIDAGMSDQIKDLPNFAAYYARHNYSSRCYAREYLNAISNENDAFVSACLAYSKTVFFLKPIWEYFSNDNQLSSEQMVTLAENVRNAKEAEEEAISYIKKCIIT